MSIFYRLNNLIYCSASCPLWDPLYILYKHLTRQTNTPNSLWLGHIHNSLPLSVWTGLCFKSLTFMKLRDSCDPWNLPREHHGCVSLHKTDQAGCYEPAECVFTCRSALLECDVWRLYKWEQTSVSHLILTHKHISTQHRTHTNKHTSWPTHSAWSKQPDPLFI